MAAPSSSVDNERALLAFKFCDFDTTFNPFSFVSPSFGTAAIYLKQICKAPVIACVSVKFGPVSSTQL